MTGTVEDAADLDRMVQRITEGFSPDKIILFGSRARGDERPDSDFDVMVLFDEVEDREERALAIHRVLGAIPPGIDLIVSTTGRFERSRNVVNTLYRAAAREGKVLYESAG